MKALDNKQIFARNLSRYVERSGKMQKDICEVIGVPTSTMSAWMMGKKYPRIDKIEKLAAYFDIQKSDLIEEKPITHDGLTDNQRLLIEFAQAVPEDKAGKVLRLLKAILEDD